MDRSKRYTDYNSYLRGLFGERVQKIAVDAGLTCPNRDGRLSDQGCIYCNARGSGTGAFARGMGIKEQIEAGKIPMMKKYKAKKFMAYFQSFSNTYTSVDHMRQMYDAAFSCDGVVGMAIGTRPDCIDEAKMDLIASYARRYLVWLEYGLQSVHDVTLTSINRGHGLKDFEKAVAMTRGRGIHICAHVILGLPGETREMMLQTARYLAESGIHGIKIHLLYVIKDTLLDHLFLSGKYQPMEQAAYVETVCDFLELLPKDIVIQRITGDPRSSELRSPAWAGRYRETFNLIQQALAHRDSFQGRKYA
ncbi:MAG: TIGR01212 family radical SAM protein [Desulfotignum sp.]|nr:TIGR01212 family radical SAM protein [Desulfotignum sp.]